MGSVHFVTRKVNEPTSEKKKVHFLNLHSFQSKPGRKILFKR